MKLSAIVACGLDGCIGANGKIPWKQPTDMGLFKELTMGSLVIGGRKTFDDIGGPLAGRRCIELSRTREPMPGLLAVNCVERAIEWAGILATADEEVFVIGGASVYRQLLPCCTTAYITTIETTTPDGDAFWPGLDIEEWRLTSWTRLKQTARDEHPMLHTVWNRI